MAVTLNVRTDRITIDNVTDVSAGTGRRRLLESKSGSGSDSEPESDFAMEELESESSADRGMVPDARRRGRRGILQTASAASSVRVDFSVAAGSFTDAQGLSTNLTNALSSTGVAEVGRAQVEQLVRPIMSWKGRARFK